MLAGHFFDLVWGRLRVLRLKLMTDLRDGWNVARRELLRLLTLARRSWRWWHVGRSRSSSVGSSMIVLSLLDWVAVGCRRRGLHGVHHRRVCPICHHAVGRVYSTGAHTVWWCHLVLLAIHLSILKLSCPLRVQHSLLHVVGSLIVRGTTHVWLHLCLRNIALHVHLGYGQVAIALGVGCCGWIGVSMGMCLTGSLLRVTRLQLAIRCVRHI